MMKSLSVIRELLESCEVRGSEVKCGAATGKLVNSTEFSYYKLNPFDSEGAVYLEDLKNGGERGGGILVVRKAVETAIRAKKVLFLVCHNRSLTDYYKKLGFRQFTWEFWYHPSTSSSSELSRAARLYEKERLLASMIPNFIVGHHGIGKATIDFRRSIEDDDLQTVQGILKDLGYSIQDRFDKVLLVTSTSEDSPDGR